MVEVDGDVAVGVNDGLLAEQLGDFADNADVAVDVVVKVGRGDARGKHLVGHFERMGCY